MCGIVGYVGDRDVVEVLLDGLSKLEYRGYDSAGVAYIDGADMKVVKTKGKLDILKGELAGCRCENTVGIGHTRWATHGEPSVVNSHPQMNVKGDIAVVHNGIIENYMKLRHWLNKKGVSFISETDTEVVAHLVNYFYEGDLKYAVRRAVRMLRGSYALAVLSAREPDTFVAVRKDSPLVIGMGDGENLVASDIPALLKYTKDVYFLNDGEIAELTRDRVEIYDELGASVEPKVFTVDWDVAQADKGGYEHFMMKEIHEQPTALYNTLAPHLAGDRLELADIGLTDELLANTTHVTIVACGTAYHAGSVGKYVIESLARIPADVDIASEFRYRAPIWYEGQLVIIVSQSGETADTIAAMREARRHGIPVLAITNVKGSTISREADYVLYTNAGMEIAVASTKAYTTQLLAFYMLALEFARVRGKVDAEKYAYYLSELRALPKKAEGALAAQEDMQRFASKRFMEHSVFFIGRGLDYALAMEGSLKLKEISYIHSEAYAAGELKHGTIALIEKDTLFVAICTQTALLDKTVSNIEEIKARGAYVFAITQEKTKDEVAAQSDISVCVPDCDDLFAPVIAIIPAQMFAYYMAVQKGNDVDKPRNLAKSVTVE